MLGLEVSVHVQTAMATHHIGLPTGAARTAVIWRLLPPNVAGRTATAVAAVKRGRKAVTLEDDPTSPRAPSTAPVERPTRPKRSVADAQPNESGISKTNAIAAAVQAVQPSVRHSQLSGPEDGLSFAPNTSSGPAAASSNYVSEGFGNTESAAASSGLAATDIIAPGKQVAERAHPGGNQEQWYHVKIAVNKDKLFLKTLQEDLAQLQSSLSDSDPLTVLKIETWVPSKKVKMLVPKTGKMSNRTKKYNDGSSVFLRCSLSPQVVNVVAHNKMFKAWADLDKLHVPDQEGPAVMPVPASHELLLSVRAWEQLSEDKDKAPAQLAHISKDAMSDEIPVQSASEDAAIEAAVVQQDTLPSAATEQYRNAIAAQDMSSVSLGSVNDVVSASSVVMQKGHQREVDVDDSSSVIDSNTSEALPQSAASTGTLAQSSSSTSAAGAPCVPAAVVYSTEEVAAPEARKAKVPFGPPLPPPSSSAPDDMLASLLDKDGILDLNKAAADFGMLDEESGFFNDDAGFDEDSSKFNVNVEGRKAPPTSAKSLVQPATRSRMPPLRSVGPSSRLRGGRRFGPPPGGHSASRGLGSNMVGLGADDEDDEVLFGDMFGADLGDEGGYLQKPRNAKAAGIAGTADPFANFDDWDDEGFDDWDDWEDVSGGLFEEPGAWPSPRGSGSSSSSYSSVPSPARQRASTSGTTSAMRGGYLGTWPRASGAGPAKDSTVKDSSGARNSSAANVLGDNVQQEGMPTGDSGMLNGSIDDVDAGSVHNAKPSDSVSNLDITETGGYIQQASKSGVGALNGDFLMLDDIDDGFDDIGGLDFDYDFEPSLSSGGGRTGSSYGGWQQERSGSGSYGNGDSGSYAKSGGSSHGSYSSRSGSGGYGSGHSNRSGKGKGSVAGTARGSTSDYQQQDSGYQQRTNGYQQQGSGNNNADHTHAGGYTTGNSSTYNKDLSRRGYTTGSARGGHNYSIESYGTGGGRAGSTQNVEYSVNRGRGQNNEDNHSRTGSLQGQISNNDISRGAGNSRGDNYNGAGNVSNQDPRSGSTTGNGGRGQWQKYDFRKASQNRDSNGLDRTLLQQGRTPSMVSTNTAPAQPTKGTPNAGSAAPAQLPLTPNASRPSSSQAAAVGKITLTPKLAKAATSDATTTAALRAGKQRPAAQGRHPESAGDSQSAPV